MDVIFERDSVCAGDDVNAPNRRTVQFDCPQLLTQLCGGKHALTYLPSVSGARTKWSVVFDGHVVAHVWHSYASDPKIEMKLVTHDMAIHGGRLFFQYDSQERHF
jgi:hypothetical protein